MTHSKALGYTQATGGTSRTMDRPQLWFYHKPPSFKQFFFFFGIPMVMEPLTKMACFVPFSKRWWQSSNWQIWCWDKFGRSKASQRAIFSQTKELSLYHRSPRNSTSNLISNHTLQQSITPGLTDHLELLRSWLSSMYVSFTQYH